LGDEMAIQLIETYCKHQWLGIIGIYESMQT
jgi:hypothetical protein